MVIFYLYFKYKRIFTCYVEIFFGGELIGQKKKNNQE